MTELLFLVDVALCVVCVVVGETLARVFPSTPGGAQ